MDRGHCPPHVCRQVALTARLLPPHLGVKKPRTHVLLYKSLRGISPLGLKVLLMEELPVEYVPRHELACPPGEATRAVDQHQSGEATHQEGAELHSPGVDVIKLWRPDTQRGCEEGAAHD